MASIITVNELPPAGSVNRTTGSIYYWYQTLDLVFPFDPITPIAHGYYGVDPDLNWVLLYTQVHDLPVVFKKKTIRKSTIQSISYSENKKLIHSLISSITYNKNKVNSFSNSKYIEFVTEDKLIQSSSLSSNLILNNKVIQCSTSSASSWAKKRLDITPTNEISILRRLKTFSTISTNLISSVTKLVQVCSSYLDIRSSDKLIQKTPIFTSNILLRSPPQFSSLKLIDIVSKQYRISTPSVLDVINTIKSNQITTKTIIDIISIQKDLQITPARPVTISLNKVYTESVRLAVDILGNDKLNQFSGISYTTAVHPKGVNRFSSVRPFVYSNASKVLTKSSIINLLPAKPLQQFSSINRIDVVYEAGAYNNKEADWILLKKLGVKDWKFLSVLEETTESFAVRGVTTNKFFHQILNASSTSTIIYGPTGEVASAYLYSDTSKTQILMSMDIEYISGFPIRNVTEIYDYNGVNYMTIEETFEQDGLNSVVSNGVTVTNLAVPGQGVMLSTLNPPSSPTVLDPVYLDSGVLKLASSSTYNESNVVGFVARKPTNTTAVIYQQGVMPGFTGLVSSADYYLDQTIPGKITNIAPLAGSNVYLKRVGVAVNSSELLIDLSQPSVLLDV